MKRQLACGIIVWFAGVIAGGGAALAAESVPVIAWSDAGDYIGQEVEVVGRVVRTNSTRAGTVFLNFADNWQGTLSIYIPKEAVSDFPTPPQELYKDKTVRIRGRLELHEGSPSLTLSRPEAVTVLADDAPLPKTAGSAKRAGASSAAGQSGGAGSSADSSSPAVIRPEEYIPTIAWDHAPAFIGQEVFVIGKVVRANRLPDGPAFLNFAEDYAGKLSLYVRKEAVANFPESPDKLYLNKTIKVRGLLYLHKGAPSMSLHGPAEVTILADNAPIPAQPIVPVKVKPLSFEPTGPEVTIASFNVLNLFDWYDNPFRADSADEATPRLRMEALAQTIRSLNADVVALVEVENRGIVELFVKAFLPDMGYEVVLVEGNDQRGIDVAVLSRLPIGPVTSYRHVRFPTGSGRFTQLRRDLLQARIEPVGGRAFDVFVVHYKSKGGSANGSLQTRLAEAKYTRAVFDELLKRDPKACFVLCGDYNDTLDSEPVQALLGKGSTRLTEFTKDLPADGKVTYNQPPYLSMIDFIMASPAMADRYVKGSYKIIPGSPETTGSDHNPVLARFKTK